MFSVFGLCFLLYYLKLSSGTVKLNKLSAGNDTEGLPLILQNVLNTTHVIKVLSQSEVIVDNVKINLLQNLQELPIDLHSSAFVSQFSLSL